MVLFCYLIVFFLNMSFLRFKIIVIEEILKSDLFFFKEIGLFMFCIISEFLNK